MSRIQCRIDYIDDMWIIKDGNGDKKSTNGTWLFAGSDEKIPNDQGPDGGMVFKAGSCLFQAVVDFSTATTAPAKP